MPSKWADRLPRIRVASGTPKHVTIVLPFYENPDFLLAQAEVWRTYPQALWPFLTVIIVDDGSPVPAVLPPALPFEARLFRITVDVAWNWLAARNIGADRARGGWLLFTDIDHVVPPPTAAALVWGVHDPRLIYAFNRREHDGLEIAPHSASFLLTRDLFWRIGGYDEALSGHYGTDGEFRRRAALLASFVVLPDVLLRYERVGDSSTTRYARKLPADAAAVTALIAARGPRWRSKVLSFPYEEVQ